MGLIESADSNYFLNTSNMGVVLFFQLLELLLVIQCQASIIDVQSNPVTFQPLQTDSLTFTCSLEDTVTSSPVDSLVGKRLTHTAENLVMVTSMVVMRNNGEHVATITPVGAAKPLLDLSNIAVTGDMNGSGHGGHLKLTWTYPTVTQAGAYTCEVNGINNLGHNVVFKKQIEINATSPTAPDLVKYIHDLKVENVEQKNNIADLTSETASMKIEIDGLKSENAEMKKDISGLHTQSDSLQKQVDGLKSENADLKTQITHINSRIDQVVSNAKRPPTLTNCHWTDYLNNWDSQYAWDAPHGAVIMGTSSYHDNHREDRRFKFHYCYLSAP